MTNCILRPIDYCERGAIVEFKAQVMSEKARGNLNNAMGIVSTESGRRVFAALGDSLLAEIFPRSGQWPTDDPIFASSGSRFLPQCATCGGNLLVLNSGFPDYARNANYRACDKVPCCYSLHCGKCGLGTQAYSYLREFSDYLYFPMFVPAELFTKWAVMNLSASAQAGYIVFSTGWKREPSDSCRICHGSGMVEKEREEGEPQVREFPVSWHVCPCTQIHAELLGCLNGKK